MKSAVSVVCREQQSTVNVPQFRLFLNISVVCIYKLAQRRQGLLSGANLQYDVNRLDLHLLPTQNLICGLRDKNEK
jgi:hypothetical protein